MDANGANRMKQVPGHLLVVVAHPDDETFGAGSVIADAHRRGLAVTVACATRGEAGEPVPGSVPPGAELAAVRERELRDAAALLGADRVIVFGWRDSGMEGEPPRRSLVAAPMADVVQSIERLVDRIRPTVVVTLDGSDGHRDHARVRDATLIAVDRAAWQVDRLYLHCLPQVLMRQWVEVLQAQQPDAAHLALGDLGTPDEDITTVIDTSHVRAIRDEAIALHASQVPPYAAMPTSLRDAFLDSDSLRRVRPPWAGGPTEPTMFPGALDTADVTPS